MGASDNVLFQWKPSDGLSKLSITASSGSPTYTLAEDYLEISLPANNTITTLIAITPTFVIPQKYRVSAKYSNLNGINVQFAVTSRFDNKINARAILQTYNKKLALSGTYFTLNHIPQSGTLSMEYDKANGVVKGYINGTLIGTVNFSQTTSSNSAVVWTNSTTSTTVRIEKILIERA
jgi:hypothetical protein